MTKTAASQVNEDMDRLAELVDRRGGRMLWVRHRDGRWYHAHVLVSLFDDTELQLNWGGPVRARGGSATVILNGLDTSERRRMLRRLCQRRAWHGYVRCDAG